MATSTASGHLLPAVTVVFFISLLGITPQMAYGAVSCSTVTSTLSSCVPYLSLKVPSPPTNCCNGVRRLNSLAATTADRRAVCNCLKQLLTGSINLARARGLPGVCRVSVPYPISPSTNCNAVK